MAARLRKTPKAQSSLFLQRHRLLAHLTRQPRPLKLITRGSLSLLNYAGSQVLATQIKQGATADVFASADQKNMKSVQDVGLMNNSSVTIFAQNKLAIIVPKANPANITSLNDLANSGVKLVVANSSVPVGNYSLQMLSKASNNSSYGAGFKTSVLANVVSEETNVNDVVVKVALGQGDAGIVYTSDVPAAYQNKVTGYQDS